MRVKNSSLDVILKPTRIIMILITTLKRNKEKLFKGRNKRNVLRLPKKEEISSFLLLEKTLHSILTVIKRSKSNMKLIKNIRSKYTFIPTTVLSI